MKYDFQDVITKLMKNKRIKDQITKLNLTNEQIIEAIPILIDMSEQKDDKNTKYLTSLYVNEDGRVKRYEVRSSYWSKFAYLENVKTSNFENIDFEDEKKFIKENSRKQVINKIKDYLDEAKTPRGLYLYGDIGVGKTFLLKIIARKLAQNNKEIAFLTVPNLVHKLKNLFTDEDTYWELINLLKDIDYLFLDDIGSEKISSWFRDDVLFSILNTRMQNSKITFFSSNYSFDKLENIQSKTSNYKYSEKDKASRFISRIKYLSEEMLLTGTNKRLMNA